MKYVVAYQSKSGNTKKIAEEIYESLSSDDKELYDIDWNRELPQADIYFIGFGVHNGSCSMDVIDCFEEIMGGRFALFATCGFVPTEKYKARLEKQLDVWMPEEAEYLGMFLCQGKAENDCRKLMMEQMPGNEERIKQMFELGATHPDQRDLQNASDFAREIQNREQQSGKIHIW